MLKLRKRTTPCVSTGKTCSASELYITDFRKVQLICLVFAFSFAEWFVVGFFFLFFFGFIFVLTMLMESLAFCFLQLCYCSHH